MALYTSRGKQRGLLFVYIPHYIHISRIHPEETPENANQVVRDFLLPNRYCLDFV